MSDNSGTIAQFAAELGLLFEPLAALSRAGRIDMLPELLGLRPTNATAGSNALRVALDSGASTAAGLPDRVAELVQALADDDAAVIAETTATLLRLTAMAMQTVRDVAGALRALGNDQSLTPAQRAEMTAFADAFVGRLLARLLVEYVESRYPHVAIALAATGVIEVVAEPGGPSGSLRAPYQRKTLRTDRLTALLSDPAGLARDAYGWGTPGFDGVALFTALQTLLRDRFNIPAEILHPAGEPALLEAFGFAAEVDPSSTPPGLRLSIRVPAGVGRTDTIDLDDWTVTLDARATFAADVEGGIRPPFDVRLDATSGTVEVDVAATFARAVDAAPILLLGTAGGSRLELGQVAVTGDVGLVAGTDGSSSHRLVLDGEITDGRLVIDASSGDGFVSTLLGGGRLESRFGVGFGFTPGDGLRFHGSGGLEIAVPVHLELGPVEVQTVYLAARLADSTVPVELSVGMSASLGPVKAAVDRLGVVVSIGFPSGGGNLGPADVSFAFKPPNGVGLSIDAGLVAGGGYLFVDQDRGEYAGALELQFAEFLDLKAIGLISTRMPDGSTGFSLLVVITAEFGTGIQLGYGFTLLAVGGILGLNRAMNLQALAEGVRTGAIESVMFPHDVVANAPRILSDLRAFFPPEQGTFVVGPMAKIGWGTPPLVTVSLGVIIEIPGNLAVLGVLSCALPSRELPLLVLQVDFVGAIEFDRSRLWFFAQLFDSRILTMTINGGMGLLVAWGDNPDLVLTVGGFHPSYRPPPLPFPVPERLAVDILNRPGALIRVSGYFAITSNTVQFGAQAELRLGFSSFGIEGHLSFDALFQFSPFRFAIAISARVSLKAFGVGLFHINLRFQLEGPAPWRAHGRGSIGFLFFEISADFDITWGESRDTTLPPVSVLPLLSAEIKKIEGWQTRLPTGRAVLVTLRPLTAGDDLVLHPSGTLVVRQRAIPLAIRLDRVGARRVGDGRRFAVVPADDSGLEQVAVVPDKFAIAQFQDMSDAQKLSLPAYGDQDAGIELAGLAGVLASARVARRSARYEQIVIDSRARAATVRLRATDGRVGARAALAGPAPRRLTSVSPAVFGQFLAGSSTSRSVLSQQDARRRQPFAATDTVRLPGQRFVVAYVRNNVQALPPGADLPGSQAVSGGPEVATFRSPAAAADALADWVAAAPELAGALHVIQSADASAPLAVPGAWSGAGDLPSATSWTTAADPVVRIGGGRLLVAGGADATGVAIASVALFAPVTNRWSAGPALGTARRLHTTTTLADGRVMVGGGLGARVDPATAPPVLASVELYDPLRNSWSTPPSGLLTARSDHSATRLDDGSVLVAGGIGVSSGERTLASTEIFHPDTGTWTAGAPMTEPRAGHQAVRLPDGRVLVVGGQLATGGRPAALAYCELYDPKTGAWMPTGELGTPRVGHQATLLGDGTVLVTGGDGGRRLPAGRYRPGSLDTTERYDPRTGVWTAVAPMPGARTRHRAVLLRSGRMLVVGGTGGPGFTAGYRSVIMYRPDTGRWSATGALSTGRLAHTAVELPDGRVLVAGGVTRSGVAAPGPEPTAPTAASELLAP